MESTKGAERPGGITTPEHESEGHYSREWAKQFTDKTNLRQLRDEHAAAFALLELLREDPRLVDWRNQIDNLLGMKPPTLEQWDRTTTEALDERLIDADKPTTDWRSYVSRDGTRFARVTVSESKDFLQVTTGDLGSKDGRVCTFLPDAPSAVAFVAQFLGVE